MRAMAVTDYSKPLELLDLPEPEIKPGYIIVRVLACGVCFSDYKTAKGKMAYSSTLELPHVPGHEISGEIAEVGPETGWQVGERVVVYHYWPCQSCTFCQRGLENLCINLKSWTGFTNPGGFEEYLAVPADRVLKVPDGITPEEAAPATCASGTAYRAVVTQGRLEAGETVLVLGVGGVGLQAVQVAQASGAHTIAVDVDQRKLDAVKQFDPAGVAKAGDEALSLAMDLSDGLGVDLIINTVGHSGTLSQSAEMVRRGGRVVQVGYYGGKDASMPSDVFALSEINVIGSRYAQLYEMKRVLSLFGTGKMRAVIDEVLPLEQANEAFDKLESGNVVGRTILRVGE